MWPGPRPTSLPSGILIIGVNFVIKVRGLVASAEREPITGVWGGAPSGSRGRAPAQGVREAKPPEAESIWSFRSANGGANLPIFVTL